jgi:DHA1 family bicyclomycin/chloramphenicol resistance-like MFS transporter
MTNSTKSPASLLAILALLSAIAPFAIDMYLPAFPQMMTDLDTSATSVQLTLTTFMLGLAVGQLVIGPLSDQFGRRRPLLLGTVVCLVASALCAVAPSIEFLIAMRFVQGFSGAAGVVLARAIITDIARGVRAAKMFSLMMTVGGIAPVLAPLLGSGVIHGFGWRGVFWVLAGLNLLMIIGAIRLVKESLPPERRSAGGLKVLMSNARQVLRNRHYLGFTLTFAFSMTAMFAYIAASPFVLQNIIGLGTTAYSLVFATIALGLTATSVVSARLVSRVGPIRLTSVGVWTLLAGSTALLLVIALGQTPAIPTLVLLFVTVSSLGLILGNATALATAQVTRYAGTGSAMLGALQFTLAAIASPLVGIAGEQSAVPMAVAMVVAAGIAALLLGTMTRGASMQPAEDRPETP